MITIGDAYSLASEILNSELLNRGNDVSRSEISSILAHILKKDLSYIYVNKEKQLVKSELDQFLAAVKKRAGGMPLQYILGSTEFMSLEFLVDNNVLIPRHETEIIVETVIDYVKDKGIRKPRILDIGTGSGCIGISIARYIEDAVVTASDVSDAALATARANAQRLNVNDRIDFLRGSLFKPAAGMFFDVIVSNPPYIPSDDISNLVTEVKDYEPSLALDGGNDGLTLLKQIISKCPDYFDKQGLLLLECGIGQAVELVQYASQNFSYVDTILDIQGIERIIFMKKY